MAFSFYLMEKNNFLAKIANVSADAAKSFLGVANVTHSTLLHTTYRNDVPFGKSGWMFNTGGGPDIHFSFNELEDVVKAYERCAPVYSIINKQAYAFANGKTWVTDLKGNESTSPWANKVRALLNRPNILQNGKQFESQMAIYLRLFGYCVILPIKPKGFPNADATALWIIPPYMCTFNFAKETFFNLKKGIIQSVVVTYGNEKTTLMPEDIIVLRDITPGFGDNLFLSSSPIKPLAQNISNLIGLYDSKGVLINYRGALGILSPQIDPNGAIAMDPKEKLELQAGLAKYGIKSGQFKFIISNSSMQWQQMGVPYRDLMLTEWAEDDTMVIADGLNYPYRLLASQSSSSMNGTEVDSFKKILYQDFVIPFACMIFEQLGEHFEAEENGCHFEKDYSKVAVLQEDDVKNATTRLLLNQALKIEYETGLLTINQWLVKLGEEPIGPQGDTRATDISNSNVPLSTIIGVGGVTSVLAVLTSSGLSEAARSSTLQIVFGISPENAALMVQGADAQAAQAAAAAAQPPAATAPAATA